MLPLVIAISIGLAGPANAQLTFISDNAAADWPGAAPVRTSFFPETTSTRGVRGARLQAQTFQVTEAISFESLLLAYEWVGGSTGGDPSLNFTKIRIVEVEDVFKAGLYESGDEVASQISVAVSAEPAPTHVSHFYAIRLDWDNTNGPLILSPRTGNQGYAVEINGTFDGGGSSSIALLERNSVDGSIYPLGRAYETIAGAPSGPFGAGTYEFPLVILGSSLAISGDLNGDGFVGQDDLNSILGNWGQFVESGNLLLGDPSDDGFVGQDDLNFVLGGWGQGTPPEVAPVPEPASIWLTGLAACGIIAGQVRRTRRHRRVAP